MGNLNRDIASLISSDNKFLENIIKHIISANGKRLRPAIVFLIARALYSDKIWKDHNHLALSIELIHTATLIHDDIVDDAEKRRNKPTINKLWDEKTAVIAGDYILAQSLIKLSEIGNSTISRFFAEVMKEVCEGEIQQHLQHNKVISLKEYIDKSRRKTALLFVLAAKSSAIIGNSTEDKIKSAENFGLNFGIMFQIVDDILNLENNEDKPFLNDLKNGIITAPVIYAIKENPEIKNCINQEHREILDYEKLHRMIIETSGIKKAKILASEYAQKACKDLSYLDESIYKTSLTNLVKFCLDRII
jgi:all-trans-nonaprenyl-diphosphate synthase